MNLSSVRNGLLHVKLSTSCPLLSIKSTLYFAIFQLTSSIKPPDLPSYKSHVSLPLLTSFRRIQLNPDVTLRNVLPLFRGEHLFRRPTTTLQHCILSVARTLVPAVIPCRGHSVLWLASYPYLWRSAGSVSWETESQVQSIARRVSRTPCLQYKIWLFEVLY